MKLLYQIIRSVDLRVLFCHDGPMKKDKDNNIYGLAHNNEMFKRYFTIGNDIKVLIRTDKIPESKIKNYSKITLDEVEIISLKNIASVRGQLIDKKNVLRSIETEIKQTDFVVARLPSFIGFLAVDVAKKMNKPYLIEVVACPWDAFWNYSLKGKLIAPIMYKKMKKEVRKSKYTTYVTNQFLQKRYPTEGKSVNVSNVSLPGLNEDALNKRIKKIQDKTEGKKIVIGTVAAVDVKYKGQQYIIDALGELKRQGITDYEYHLVGGGDSSYLKHIAEKNNVADQIKFLGAIPHENIFDWLETIDIYTQPSRQEGLPRALIEAMSKAVPAFGANTAGIPELLESDFIFSNTKKNTKEICEILRNFNEEKMLNQAKRNFKESKKYEKNTIETKRAEFFKKFKYSKDL